jgi:formiminotetrahydrofolate cyclodeaminase
MPRLIDGTVLKYCEELNLASPTPGGGSASALAGALAASLAGMVAGLTGARKKFENVRAEMETVAGSAEQAKIRLLELVDDDASAYRDLMAAYRMPCGTEGESEARTAAVQEAVKAATQVPMATARMAMRVLESAAAAAEKGNPAAASDAGVSALLARAAVEGALLNVETNLPSVAAAGLERRVLETVRSRFRR